MTNPSDSNFKPDRFSNLDVADQTAEYVNYLEQSGSRLRGFSRARYPLLDLHPGHRVIDLGCGLGDNARELAAMVGPHGKVMGIDSSVQMIEQARLRSQSSEVPVEFAAGDVHQLEFPDAYFDACWTERVLQHLADPDRAIKQMVRVMKPGGRLVVFEPDHATLVIDAADRATTRAVVISLADSIRSSWIGRALFGLFMSNGLAELAIIPSPIVSHSLSDTNALLRLDAAARAAVQHGLITEQAASQWFDDLTQRDNSGRFFGCLLCFTAVGRKPEAMHEP